MTASQRSRGWRRLVVGAVAVVAVASGLSGCVSEAGALTSSTLNYQGTPSTVQFPELAEDLGYFHTVKLHWTGDTTSGPTSIQNVATGASDFGSAFNGAIVKLIAAGAPLTAVVDSYGADDENFTGYYALKGSGIRSAKDLIGKRVGMNTLGAHHESITKTWLARQGLTKAQIAKVELTVVPPVNTEQALRKHQIDVGTLTGVFRDQALARGGLRELYADKDLYSTFSYGTYVFRDDVVKQNPEAVADFTQGTARAIRWTQVQPRAVVITRFQKIMRERGRNEDPAVAQFWKSSGIPKAGGVIQRRELTLWNDWLVGEGQLDRGEVDVDRIFTNRDNPYANGTYSPTAGPNG